MSYKDLPIEAFKESLLQVDRIEADKIFESCYLVDNDLKRVENLTMMTLEEIGLGWENGEYSLSQIYMSGVICQEIMEKYIQKFDVVIKNDYKIGIAVLEDHHALGKRIVYSILRSKGYDVIDLGQGLSIDTIVNETINHKLDFLIISTLMLSSALHVKTVVKKLRQKKANVKIIAGGAPFRLDAKLWQKVNVDADGENATDVPRIIEKLANGGV